MIKKPCCSRFSLHKFVHLKFFWTQFENVHLQGPCSLRPCISRPYCIRFCLFQKKSRLTKLPTGSMLGDVFFAQSAQNSSFTDLILMLSMFLSIKLKDRFPVRVYKNLIRLLKYFGLIVVSFSRFVPFSSMAFMYHYENHRNKFSHILFGLFLLLTLLKVAFFQKV